MAFAFFWFAFSIAVGVWASNKGQGGIGWFFLSLLISPLLAGIFLALSKNLKSEALLPNAITHVRCVACAEFVLPAATKCKHCGETLLPQLDHSADIIAKQASRAKIGTWVSVVVWVLLGFVAYGVLSTR